MKSIIFLPFLLVLPLAVHANCIEGEVRAMVTEPSIDQVFEELKQRSYGGLMRSSYGHARLPEFESNKTRLDQLIESESGSQGQSPIAIVAPFQRGKTTLLTRMRVPDNAFVLNLTVVGAKELKHIAMDIVSSLSTGKKRILDRDMVMGLQQKIFEGKVDYTEALREVNALVAQQGKKLVLVLDEVVNLEDLETHVPVLAAKSEVPTFLIIPHYKSAAKIQYAAQVEAAFKASGTARVFEILPESKESIAQYLHTAFNGRVRFTPEAIDAIHRASGGWPKEVNYIVGHLPRDLKVIDAGPVVAMVKNLFDTTSELEKKAFPDGSTYFGGQVLFLVPPEKPSAPTLEAVFIRLFDLREALEKKGVPLQNLVAEVSQYGEAGKTVKARALIGEILAKLESEAGAPLRLEHALTVATDSKFAKEIARRVQEVLPLLIAERNGVDFDISTGRKCYSKCGSYSRYLFRALNLIGVRAKFIHTLDHEFVKVGDLIIDPTITQFVNDPGMKGIFVGTGEDLTKFMRAHPDSLQHLGSPPPHDVDQVYSRLWGNGIVIEDP